MPKRATPRPYTEDDEALLRSLVELGRTDEEIAVALDRTRAAISTYRRSLGLKTARRQGRPRSFDYVKIDSVRERILAGESVSKIAVDMQMQPSSLYMRLRLAATQVPADG